MGRGSQISPKLAAELAEARAKQTKGRLISRYTNPNDNPTPGADYKKSPEDVKKAFADTQAHTQSQWQGNEGVVGPTGSEGNWFFKQFNTPTSRDFGGNQDFAAQHDMQATDADMQAKGWAQRWNYKRANIISAAAGMAVQKATGSTKASLAVTKGIFKFYGFSVRNDYYSGGGASGGW